MLLDSKTNMLSSELCKSVIAMNNHIEFVAIIDKRGRIRESQGRSSAIKKLTSTSKEIFFMENALVYRMRKDFDESLGELRFTYVERARRGLFYFPMADQLLLVSFLRIHVNSLTLARSITQLVSKYKKKLEKIS
jgi:hypothetical protein